MQCEINFLSNNYNMLMDSLCHLDIVHISSTKFSPCSKIGKRGVSD